MAASTFSPSGFSYAQAARGRASVAASQTSSSKAASGAVTPATGTNSELPSGGDWAEDVEASMGEKKGESHTQRAEENKEPHAKESAVERAKSEDKAQTNISNSSSPDLGPSGSTTTKEDDASSVRNAPSSESTWETKSQSSEPAWITDRKDRQSISQSSESTVKAGKENQQVAEPVFAKLQEAAPPPVNPWIKRAEEAKAKLAASQPQPKTGTPAAPAESSELKENQNPPADNRRKANSLSGNPSEVVANIGDDSRKSSGFPSKRAKDGRPNVPWQGSKPAAGDARSEAPAAGAARDARAERHSLPNLASAPPPVKDDVSWPTPESSTEKDRVDVSDKDLEKREDDTTPTNKRNKREWSKLPIVPSVVFQTQGVNEFKEKKARGHGTAERGGRGGNGARGRGGYRGVPNAGNGGDRHGTRKSSLPETKDAEGSTFPLGRSDTVDSEAVAPASRIYEVAGDADAREKQQPRVPGQNAKDQESENSPCADQEPSTASGPGDDVSDKVGRMIPQSQKPTSSKNNDILNSDSREDEVIPKPIPRRSSVGTQTEDVLESTENTNRDGPHIRRVPSDNRRDTRSFEHPRDTTFSGPPRGGKRNGRGRGGNAARDIPNGHPAGHSYAGSFQEPNNVPYGVSSHSAYQMPRGNHQFYGTPPGRQGWARGGARSQSIPVDNYYGRFGPHFNSMQPQLAPIQTYAPAMYDVYGNSMSAVPYTQNPLHQVVEMLKVQLEYYFSQDNMIKDVHLRKHMDSQGFVFMEFIAGFNRIKSQTNDKEVIKAACMSSDIIEVLVGDDGKERLRRRQEWQTYVLPKDQREESAQNDGPARLDIPEVPEILAGNAPIPQGPYTAHPAMMTHRPDGRSFDSAFAMMNGSYAAQFNPYAGAPEAMYGETTNNEEMRGRSAKSSMHANGTSPLEQLPVEAMERADVEPDTFQNDQIDLLTVVVKENEQRTPHHTVASRTFSNGSIDSSTIRNDADQPNESSPQPLPNGEGKVNGHEGEDSITSRLSPTDPRSKTSSPLPSGIFWVKNHEQPIVDLPPGLTSEPYEQLRYKALLQRQQAATGQCPHDLDILYQFWCHFLLRNFNSRMYGEFRYWATKDAQDRHTFHGLKHLLQYYSQALSGENNSPTIRDVVAKDYVELVKNEPAELEGAAFKHLRLAWRNGALNLKNRKKIADIVGEELKVMLDKVDT